MKRVMFISLIVLLVPIAACNSRPPAYVSPSERKPVKQGHKFKFEPANRPDVNGTILEYEGFTVSYNPRTRIPNWVTYEFTAEETNGPYSRKGKDFQADPKAGVSQSDAYDYRGSGWSRGHMAPAADFKWSDKAMTETFYYTNICLQDRELNNRYWNTLENKVRSWANQFGRVYVVTGPIIGKNVNGSIGSHHVVVPDAFFKAVLAPLSGGWTLIAFLMENTPDSRYFKDCATTVNAVEELTGIDFFSSLDDSIEENVENLLDYKTWRVY